MQFIKWTLLAVLVSTSVQAKKLEQIKTKQAINNIRFISSNGKYTYFTNKSGELKFSHNYDIKTVVKGSEYTNYLIRLDQSQEKIAIEKIPNPHRKNWFFNHSEILISSIGDEQAEKIGEGVNPAFHQNGKLLSYYRPKTGEIIIVDLVNKEKNYQIKLTNKKNPFFIPDVYMVTPNDVVYTDVNSKGNSAILMYSLIDKEFETIYKSQEISKKLELCIHQDAAIIGEFPYNTLGRNSSITRVELFNNLKFQTSRILYSSPFADIGNMICKDDSVYFVKTKEYQRKIGFKKTDVAELKIKQAQVKLLTDLDDVLQITEMGDMILTPYKGKLLVITGKNVIRDDTIRKGKL